MEGEEYRRKKGGIKEDERKEWRGKVEGKYGTGNVRRKEGGKREE